ncbi:MAG: alginate lyase family protein [Cyclobacteriaceae bacterium]
MIRRIVFLLCWLTSILIAPLLQGQIPYKSTPEYTLPDFVRQNPERVTGLFEELNLTYPGLQSVQAFVKQAKWVEACQALLNYYRKTAPRSKLYRPPIPPSSQTDATGEAILQGNFTFQQVSGQIPLTDQGHLDWHYLGPNNDKEWGYFLNRHTVLVQLLSAYRSTGNERYAQACSYLMLDWVQQNPPPEEDVRSVTWRQLEVGKRLSPAWPRLFYGFISTEAFSDVALISMLTLVPAHAHHIQQFHLKHSNWTIMEMQGLASAALYWPEFEQADTWYQYSLEQMQYEVQQQVYPDGAQTELTTGYHYVALNNFNQFVMLLEEHRKLVPQLLHQRVEQMYHYLAYTLRPNGINPLNNDTDLRNFQEIILDAARRYRRPDWIYIVTNGSKGSLPPGEASQFFPWAGQAVFRSGWKATDQWAFFDMGPWGTGHQHNDKLHFSLSAFGQDLLVDAGRYWYRKDEWREYFQGSASHNVILVDGLGQLPTEEKVEDPIEEQVRITEAFDFGYATYPQGFGTNQNKIPASHTRAVVQLKEEQLWLVVDQITTDQARNISALWHFHPAVATKSLPSGARGTINGITLDIIPIADISWKMSIVRGQTDPSIQGWYSPEYNRKQAAPVALFQAPISNTQIFGWLMQAHKKDKESWQGTLIEASNTMLHLRLNTDEEEREIIVNFDSKTPTAFTNGYQLQGRFGILSPTSAPQVAFGKIYDQGKLIKQD